jgi:hypothetical protein
VLALPVIDFLILPAVSVEEVVRAFLCLSNLLGAAPPKGFFIIKSLDLFFNDSDEVEPLAGSLDNEESLV